MFFKINAECHIGFKKLTAADLGIGTSHQTHIGLYEGVLNFLPECGCRFYGYAYMRWLL